MMENTVKFKNDAEVYFDVANKYIDDGRYEDALRYLFRALEKDYSAEILSAIAELYSEMDFYELSNKYWIKYLDVSPEKEWGKAYEEMGINYFCMDNPFLSSYYFNKKISVDGFLKREDLSDEIAEYLSNTIDKMSLYKIVYPFNEADFSEELKTGRLCLSGGDSERAIEYFDKIPKGAKEYYDALDEKSLAYIISGDLQGAKDINKQLIEENGESVSAFCNLASIYHIKGDDEKSRYYYDRALATPVKRKEEEFKLATCSIEANEHEKAVYYLERLLRERRNEPNLSFLLGLAYINSGRTEKAKETFYKLLTFSPDNPVYEYYLRLCSDLIGKVEGVSNMLPLAYEEALPRSVAEKIKRRVKRYLTLELTSVKRKLSSREFLFDMNWAFKYGDFETCKTAGFLLVSLHDERSNKIIRDILTDSLISDNYKGALLFTWLANGEKGNIGVSCGHFYNRIRVRKLAVEDDESATDLFLSYVLLMTRLAFIEIDNFDKVSFALNKVYKKFKKNDDLSFYTREEIGGLILYLCNYVRFKDKKEIARFMKIKSQRLDRIIKLYNGEL